MKTLDYATGAAEHPPARWWLPGVLLLAGAVVWHRPRLTPTCFPGVLDDSALVILFVGATAVGRWSRVPAWATLAFGGVAVCLFLLANFNDNNFRANTGVGDVAVPWAAYVVFGGVAARVLASLGRRAIT